jgi:hypothetical protein
LVGEVGGEIKAASGTYIDFDIDGTRCFMLTLIDRMKMPGSSDVSEGSDVLGSSDDVELRDISGRGDTIVVWSVRLCL